jgi:hypothetical protein
MKEIRIKVIWLFFSLAMTGVVYADNLLQFNPPESLQVKATSHTVRVESRNGSKVVDTTDSESEGHIVKTSSGWTLTNKVASVHLAPGTDQLKKTLIDLLIGTETSLYINPQGKALSASGYDELLARLDSGVQTPIKSAIRQVFTPKALAARDLNDWNIRVEGLVGRPLKIGRIETRQSDGPSDGGPKFSLLSATVFEDTIRLDGALCLKVGIFSDTDPARLAEALHKSVPEVMALFQLTDSAVVNLRRHEIEYSSHLHITMDAATLLERAESLVRTMTVAVPGKDGTTSKRQTWETVEKAISYY